MAARTYSSVRFSVDHLKEFLCVPSWNELAVQVGCSRENFYRWRTSGGIPSKTADEIAVRLGYHPWQIWHDWFETALDEPRCPRCNEFVPFGSRFCGSTCWVDTPRVDTRRRSRRKVPA